MENNKNFNQKLRVWWMPQIGTNAIFHIPVNSVEDGKKVIDLLSAYDCFQFNHNIKGDYCNAGGLQMYDEEERSWLDWEYEDKDCYYDSIDEYCQEVSPQGTMLNEFSKNLFEQVHFD